MADRLRSDTVVCLLAGGRRTPKGERAIVERLRSDALSRESNQFKP
jgi:hypothetical protein